MTTVAFIAFLCLLFVDIRALRRESETAFDLTFQKSRWIIIFLTVLGLLVWCANLADPSAPSSFFLLFLVPFYVYKRQAWLKEIEAQQISSEREFSHAIKLKIEAFGVLLHWTAWMIFLAVSYWCIDEMLPRRIPELMEVIISAAYSSLVLVILIYHSSKSFSPRGFWFNMGLRRGKTAWGRIIFWPALLGLVFAALSSWIIVGRDIQPQTPLGDILDQTTSADLLLMFLGLALAVAPFVEEITFRGYFYHIIKKNKGRRVAIVVIALTFALLHVQQYWGDWLAIGMVTVLGFALTITRARTGSTIGGVVMHYVYNAGVTIIPAIVFVTANFSYIQYQMEFNQLNFSQKEYLLTKNIANQPKFPESYNDLAWLYSEEGTKLEEANNLIDQALLLVPESEAFMDTKAEVLTKLGRFEEALELRRRIYAGLDPDSAERGTQQQQINELEKKLLISPGKG